MMTTHDLALACQADRLLLLGADGLVADGPPDRVLGERKAWERLGIAVPAWVKPPMDRGAERVWDRQTVEGAA
jgi:energy-coupling factor transporter ATP-binding protein EcfA2